MSEQTVLITIVHKGETQDITYKYQPEQFSNDVAAGVAQILFNYEVYVDEVSVIIDYKVGHYERR